MLPGGPHRFAEPPLSHVRRVWLDAVRHESKQPRMPGGDIWRGIRFRTSEVLNAADPGYPTCSQRRRKT